MSKAVPCRESFVAAVDAQLACDVLCRRSGLWRRRWLQAVVRARSPQENGLLEKRESIYNNIFIFGDKENVSMTFGHNKRYYTESSMRLSDPGLLTVDYTRYMTLGVAYPPKAERIVEIGLGGGRTVSYLKGAMPDTAILAVEIDKDVVDLARKYFKFAESATLRAVVADGRSYLMRDSEKWDVILIDAYRGPFVPFHLLTREFYTLVKSRLESGRGGGAEHRALDHAVRQRDRDAADASSPRSTSMTAAATSSRSATKARRSRSRNCWRAPRGPRSATIPRTICAPSPPTGAC